MQWHLLDSDDFRFSMAGRLILVHRRVQVVQLQACLLRRLQSSSALLPTAEALERECSSGSFAGLLELQILAIKSNFLVVMMIENSLPFCKTKSLAIVIMLLSLVFWSCFPLRLLAAGQRQVLILVARRRGPWQLAFQNCVLCIAAAQTVRWP